MIIIIIVEEKQIEAETQEKGREGIILMTINIMIIVEGKEIETEIQEKDRGEGIILMMITIIIIVEGKGKQIETLKGESTLMNNNQKQHQTERKQMEQKERIINRIMAEAAAQDGTCHNTMDEVFIEM